MTDDIFDIVDCDDNVIGSAPRSLVHARGLLHRSAHVLIFTDSLPRKILLQKRSMLKDSNPGLYTTSCSGHIDSGENANSVFSGIRNSYMNENSFPVRVQARIFPIFVKSAAETEMPVSSRISRTTPSS